MKVGDIIKPKTDKSGKHWLADSKFELLMEYYRQQNYPDLPSRLNCVYSSAVPRSRFKDKGYLYVINPIGKTLITDSSIIDIMEEKFRNKTIDFYDMGIKNDDIKSNPGRYLHYIDGYLVDKYWKGKIKNIKNKIDDVEILSDSAKIIEVVNEPDKLVVGNNVIVTESDKVYCDLKLYLENEMVDKYKEKNDSTFNSFIQNIENIFSSDIKKEFSEYDHRNKSGMLNIEGYLKNGTKLKVLLIESSGYRRYEYDDENTYDRGKYKKISFGFYLKNKYYDTRKNEEKKGLPEYRMIYADSLEYSKNRELDISKFLKKI
jgi:hypothetical protein